MDQGFWAWVATLQGDDIAWGALVTIAVVSIFRGWLVPVGMHKARIGDKDQQIAALRESVAAAEETIDTLLAQNTDLIRSNETASRALESLRDQSTKGRTW